MATAQRRSIVEFEKWLATEIENVKTELYGLRLEAESVSRKQQMMQVKLETLQAVAERVAVKESAPEEEPALV